MGIFLGLLLWMWAGYLVVSRHPRKVPLEFCSVLIVAGAMMVGWGLASLITG